MKQNNLLRALYVLCGLISTWSPAAARAENFDSNDVKIYYVTQGAGEPIVLIHGFAASAEMWNPVVPELAKDHQVIAFDVRGHGKGNRRRRRAAARPLEDR
jgi:pimeloyl-ACP methyl ester carboxylesterase